MTRRVGVLLLLAVALLGPWPAGPASAVQRPSWTPQADHVVVVGVPGLVWSDVDQQVTPTLWGLTGSGAVGALSVRAASSVTCPLDGWATLGAGNRARAPSDGKPGCDPYPPLYAASRSVAQETIAADNRGLLHGTRIGALGAALQSAGLCATAIGPGAALAAATPSGDVAQVGYHTDEAALYRRCALTIVGLRDLQVVGPEDTRANPSVRRTAVARVDTALRQVVAALPAHTLLLVAGISETGRYAPHLHVLIARGVGAPHTWLVSPSTRRAPYVQLIDLAPTVLQALGVTVPRSMAGQGLHADGTAPAATADVVDRLVLADRAAEQQRPLVPPFFAVLVGGQAGLYLLAALGLRQASSRGERGRLLGVVRAGAIVGAAGVIATYLANVSSWWRFGHPAVALWVSALVATAVVAGVALAGPWRRTLLGPPGVVAGVTFGVLAADLVSGAHLQLNSLAGYSPLVAGRFVGVGNVAYAVFASAALLSAALLCVGRGRRARLAIVAGLGLVAVVIDGAPAFGDDFGGVLALVPAFVVLGLLVTGTRVSVGRLAAAGGAAVVAVTGFALLDYSRPPADRSHLGRFVDQVLHGGAGTVIHRKAQANLHLLTHSVLTLLVPLAIALVTVLLFRPWGGLRRAFDLRPELRDGLIAVLVMGVVGFAVNDSGVAIPAIALTVAIPVAVAVAAEAARRPPADGDAPDEQRPPQPGAVLP